MVTGELWKECPATLSEEFLPLAIPVLAQFQFIPHPAAVVGRLSLSGGAAQFVIFQMFQPLDDFFMSLFASGALPWSLVVESRNGFIQTLVVVLIQHVVDNLSGNLRINRICGLLVAIALLVAFFLRH